MLKVAWTFVIKLGTLRNLLMGNYFCNKHHTPCGFQKNDTCQHNANTGQMRRLYYRDRKEGRSRTDRT
jgi:hypothetical protein